MREREKFPYASPAPTAPDQSQQNYASAPPTPFVDAIFGRYCRPALWGNARRHKPLGTASMKHAPGHITIQTEPPAPYEFWLPARDASSARGRPSAVRALPRRHAVRTVGAAPAGKTGPLPAWSGCRRSYPALLQGSAPPPGFVFGSSASISPPGPSRSPGLIHVVGPGLGRSATRMNRPAPDC